MAGIPILLSLLSDTSLVSHTQIDGEIFRLFTNELIVLSQPCRSLPSALETELLSEQSRAFLLYQIPEVWFMGYLFTCHRRREYHQTIRSLDILEKCQLRDAALKDQSNDFSKGVCVDCSANQTPTHIAFLLHVHTPSRNCLCILA